MTSIKGGNDRLPYAFAAALGPRVKYRSEVVRIAQDRHGVTIGFKDGTGRHQLRADRCVCALPFAPLRRVHIAAGFSHRKMAAIDQLKYMAAARCYFQTRTRFWKHAGHRRRDRRRGVTRPGMRIPGGWRLGLDPAR